MKDIFQMDKPWITRAAAMLDDPVIMEWALRFYLDRIPGSATQRALETTWFHDDALQHAIDNLNPSILGMLLFNLPEQRFTAFGPSLAAGLTTWPIDLSNVIGKVLVSIDPELAARTFLQILSAGQHIEHLYTISTDLEKMPQDGCVSVLEKLLPVIATMGGMDGLMLRESVLAAVVRHHPSALPELIEGVFPKDGPLKDCGYNIANSVFGNESYALMIYHRLKTQQLAPFKSLALLFEDGAPLAAMDAAMRSRSPAAVALQLLESCYQRSRGATLLWQALLQCKATTQQKAETQIAVIALVSVIDAYERKTIDTATLSLEELVTLQAQDVAHNIHTPAIVTSIKTFPKKAVLKAVNQALVTVNGHYCISALAHLMGELAYEEFIPSLLGCLRVSQADLLSEAARDALAAIGAAARDALISHWNVMETQHYPYIVEVFARVGGVTVTEFALKHTELLRSAPELWCRLALAAPDLRLLNKLRPELPRQQPSVETAFYCLARLLGVEEPEVAEMRERMIRHQQARRRGPMDFDLKHRA